MKATRREFVGALGATVAALAVPGCATRPLAGNRRMALQLYSIRTYIERVGLAKALAEVAKIGFDGVEFAGYHGFKAGELKAMLDDAGLACCGTQVENRVFSPEYAASTCEFVRTFGCDFLCCTGGGNFPPGCDWGTESVPPSEAIDSFTDRLADYYNRAAVDCARYGCRIGIHNHMWEFLVRMTDGTPFWDRFLAKTDPAVLMELDVGWATCAGFDPAEQFRRHPGRSFALHAKENGMGKHVTSFDGILGRPGRPGAVPVDWDRLLPVAAADGVKWFVVECERGENGLDAVKPSFAFLHAKLAGLES